ncbi:hypothetical protein P691DRAFT_793133 [Macrolepiota fuliginosa MF-IS2]|uniref:TPX2 C-terminal domain-containing protein n=1 Tax=Macrolepiota fuliginosa MF-IS2 TaxID=1400762 RepID=A0A9P5XCK6_9AGAR|nr:hypothetical protein P691DRAFT_793133 [Macrolepiota fuliginosa MF-IS2]
MQTRKKSRGHAIAVSQEARSGSSTAVLPRTAAFTPGGSLSTTVPTTLSLTPEMGLNSSRAAVNDLGVIKENEGVREGVHEENAVDIGHAKIKVTPEMISTSGGGSYQVETESGLSANAKKPVKRMFGHGARDRVRRVSKTSSSANGPRSLRPRSISNSASSRAEVLHASERGRRLAQLRTRKEVRRNDKRNRPGEVGLNSGDAEEKSSTDEHKRSNVTYPASTTRPVEFKFASDLRIQARKGDGERMTRSASSLSGSSSDIGTSRRTRPIPNYQVIHTTQDAELAHRKENIHPVIPQPFQWATEQRTRERKKFDEMVKEKEKEREQLEEQKRREREQEEEREVRELRKRTVPKANVVPDWYKDVPRKRKDEETVDSGSR